MKKLDFIVDEKSVDQRIDLFLSDLLPLSRTQIQNLIKTNKVLVNKQKIKANYKVQLNDQIALEYVEAQPLNIQGEKMDLDIIYEDEDLLVINKPKGMVVHPGNGNYEHTLVNGLLYHCEHLSDSDDDMRPGIVHRIDKDTSGLLVCAKNNLTHAFLSEQLSDKRCFRRYYALVEGVLENDEGIIDAPIGRDLKNRQKMCVTAINSKKAITRFKVLKRYADMSLLDVELATGRTHQIRVHMQFIHHPVVNDPKYGHQIIDESGQYLQAYYLSFIHPKTNERMEFTIPMAEYMTDYLEKKEDVL